MVDGNDACVQNSYGLFDIRSERFKEYTEQSEEQQKAYGQESAELTPIAL